MICNGFLDRVFTGLLKDEKAMIVQPRHILHLLRTQLPLLRQINVYGAGRREFGLFEEGPPTGDGIHA